MNLYSRRRVLKMAGLVGVTTAAGHLLPLPQLNAAQPDPQAPALADFMQLSTLLVQQDGLNTTVGAALFHALSKTQKNFAVGLTQLKALLTSQPERLEQDLLHFAESESTNEKLAKAILGGWYNGVVGKGNDALYVTYVNTLASQLVKDKVVPPGFSYGACGSWARQP